jgi:hypothetical protein
VGSILRSGQLEGPSTARANILISQRIVVRLKPRSPFSFILPSDFKLSEADWKKLETAYGRKIPEKARREITTATRHMLSRTAAERSARDASEAIQHIARLRKAANDLLAAWTASGLPASPLTDSEFPAAVRADPVALAEARVARANAIARARACVSRSIDAAEEAINQALAEMTDDVTFDEFHDHLMLFAGACGRALETAALIAVRGARRQAWDAWIRDLRKIWTQHRRRPTARQDDDADTKASPFVSFVWELQQLIPSEYRRGMSYKPTLAKEITGL